VAGCLTAGPTVRRFVLTAGHQPPTKLCRHGFTLVELLLVLALIVTVGAIAWPSIQHGYDNFKLKRAADQVVTAFGHARVQAMSKGLTQVFRCESGTPRYTVEVLPDETMPVDDGTAGLGSAPAGGGNSQNQSTSSKAGQLPDGYVFSNAQRVLDNRAAATETELSSSGTSGDLPPILFYPDGTSSEAFVTVSDKNGLSVSVSIRGLTSFARTGDIFRSQATSP
jgi:prepilin-type N-terminal cleavage/methylation domain-containing protein